MLTGICRLACALSQSVEEHRIVTVAASALLLSACTATVQPPPAFSGTQRENGLTYAQAIDHLNTARDGLQNAMSRVENFDNLTKAGAGIGAAGAAIGAVFQSSANLILGFLSVGASSYAANQLAAPHTLSAIYSAGLSNLQCIDLAGSAAYRTMTPIADELVSHRRDLMTAISNLRLDVMEAGVQGKYKADVDLAITNIASAEQVRTEIDSFLNAANIPEKMVMGIDNTVNAVNQEVLSKSPSIDAVYQASSIFSSINASSIRLSAQVNSARTQTGETPLFRTEAANDPLEESFATHEKELRKVLAVIPTTLDTTPATAIGQCKAQFAADAPISIQPSGPINLRAGTSVALSLPGDSLYRPVWIGDIPQDIDVNIDPDILKLSAHPDAKDHTYNLKVIDRTNKSSPLIQINVHSKATGSATQSPRQQMGATRVPPAGQPVPIPAPPPNRHMGGG
jgi:hypothetical protein